MDRSERDIESHETPAQRLDRNWAELIQELRVTQTGIQVLTGFLLTVPFSHRFASLTTLQRDLYLGVLTGAVLSTALIMTPGACHRMLFRRGKRPWLVATANRFALAGLGMIALTTGGVAFLVFDITAGLPAGIVAGVVAWVVFVLLWVVFPLVRPRSEKVDQPGPAPARRG
ncbi:DUF6328 family protein [Nocardioides terrisoli]|uniref:DUF6328 family protein n=1 Tax=Nocardioides terrisoli TaxID=3388267 RepID=UPI00287B730F|nr:DUF6328 family protein [Nocardioides marmorisolisilvae]